MTATRDKTHLVRDIRRATSDWPQWWRTQLGIADWRWRPSWLIARRCSHYDLLELYQEVHFARGDMLEDDEAPS